MIGHIIFLTCESRAPPLIGLIFYLLKFCPNWSSPHFELSATYWQLILLKDKRDFETIKWKSLDDCHWVAFRSMCIGFMFCQGLALYDLPNHSHVSHVWSRAEELIGSAQYVNSSSIPVLLHKYIYIEISQ